MSWRLALVAWMFFEIAVHAKSPPPGKSPTFNRDIAPIIFEECVVCHHPGGDAPFSLATYEEVKKRAKLLAHVTASRYMPPWPPEAGHGAFVGERRLTAAQIDLIENWRKGGAPEGIASELKVKPQWSDDWQLGEPDLLLAMPEPYTLPAGGKDVYRNFVIPQVVPGNRYLRAVEFRPNVRGAVHHAFILFDDTGEARRRAARQDEPGFPGMNAGQGARTPDGMFFSWQPGKRTLEAPAGLTEVLRKSTDIVLQLHMRPTGKPEKIQASVALYFTDQPPTRKAFRLLLRSVEIDIPAGTTDYAIESSYKLPVEVELLGLLPHLHYLGKEVHGWAELPDGTKQELISIRQWDFNWQGDYRYATPLVLPKGSTLRMRYTYDNSAGNVRNPNPVPKRVIYGLQSSDEMGELWLQLLPRNPADFDLLSKDYFQTWALADKIALNKALLKADPSDAEVRTELAVALLMSGRVVEARQHLKQAISDNPKIPRAYTTLAEMFLRQNDLPKALEATKQAVELDPENAQLQNNLGWLLITAGDSEAAIKHLEIALKLDPTDTLARQNLEKAKAMDRKPQGEK
ncbi:MAG: hypothetical protein JWL59_2426 [Chthoniobacteraceae bacterium]|nr:hypothetical protein [Chthoniobacteraceae bacterium]